MTHEDKDNPMSHKTRTIRLNDLRDGLAAKMAKFNQHFGGEIRPSEIVSSTQTFDLDMLLNLPTPNFQRKVKLYRVTRIVKNFNPNHFGIPVVGKIDGDPNYYILDGQHRLAAYEAVVFRLSLSTSIVCDLKVFNAKEDMVRAFVSYNQDRVHLSRADKLNARIISKEPAALEFIQFIEDHGFHIVSGKAVRFPNVSCSEILESKYIENKEVLSVALKLGKWLVKDESTLTLHDVLALFALETLCNSEERSLAEIPLYNRFCHVWNRISDFRSTAKKFSLNQVYSIENGLLPRLCERFNKGVRDPMSRVPLLTPVFSDLHTRRGI
jgi:hypothetical protein